MIPSVWQIFFNVLRDLKKIRGWPWINRQGSLPWSLISNVCLLNLLYPVLSWLHEDLKQHREEQKRLHCFLLGPLQGLIYFLTNCKVGSIAVGQVVGVAGERGLRILRCFLSHVNTTFWVVSFRCPPSNWQINRGFSLNGSSMSTLYSSSVWGNDKHPALQARVWQYTFECSVGFSLAALHICSIVNPVP